MLLSKLTATQHLSRLRVLSVLFLAVSNLGLLACNNENSQVNTSKDTLVSKQETQTSSLQQIQVCYSAASGADSIIWYAYEKGLFQKYNLNINLFYVKGGSKAAIALVTQKADFCQMAGSAVVNAAVSGQEVIIIADFYKTSLFTLLVKPEIKTAQDLQNQILANNEPGGAADAALRHALQHLGLTPSQDVKLLKVGDHGDRLAAMESDRVAGTVLTAPLNFKAKAKGYRELLDIAALNSPYSYVGLVSTKSYLKQNPEIVKRFLMANIAAIAMMKSDREGYIAVLAKYLKLDITKDADILNQTYESVVQKYLLDVPYPNLAGVQAILATAKEAGSKGNAVKAENIVDASYIRELENIGFIQKIKTDINTGKAK